MRLLVCGDRNWKDDLMVWELMTHLSPSVVIEGHCRGADQFAHHWAMTEAARGNDVRLICQPADWKKYGRAAGPIRNREMLKEAPDLVLAFHDSIEASKGTADMLCATADARIPYFLAAHEIW